MEKRLGSKTSPLERLVPVPVPARVTVVFFAVLFELCPWEPKVLCFVLSDCSSCDFGLEDAPDGAPICLRARFLVVGRTGEEGGLSRMFRCS